MLILVKYSGYILNKATMRGSQLLWQIFNNYLLVTAEAAEHPIRPLPQARAILVPFSGEHDVYKYIHLQGPEDVYRVNIKCEAEYNCTSFSLLAHVSTVKHWVYTSIHTILQVCNSTIFLNLI